MIIHDVEQNTPEWFALRAGIPTASKFKSLVTSEGEPSKSIEIYSYTLAAESYTGGEVDGFEGNAHTERAHELEPAALDSYSSVNDVDIERVGFVTSDDGSIGCSPDGLIGDDGLIEVKCLGHKAHIETILYFQKNSKAPPAYYQQAQGQMMICGRKWCDLFFYHPTLPYLIIRQLPKKIFQEALMEEINTVIARRDEIVAVLKGL